MLRSTADTLSNSAIGVCVRVLPEQLPDDPAVLKALLLAQQRAFEAQLAAQLDAQRLEQEQAFTAREAELHKAFEARILEIYEQLRLARQRMFGPSSESHAGQAWLFDEAEGRWCTINKFLYDKKEGRQISA